MGLIGDKSRTAGKARLYALGGVTVLLLFALWVTGGVNKDTAPKSANSGYTPAEHSSTGASGTSTPPRSSTSAAEPAPALQPGPPVNPPPGKDPALPWAAPPPPPNTTTPADPASTYAMPALPAELAAPAGQAAYRFIIAWDQAFLSRASWETEWVTRWTPYASDDLTGTAKQAAADMWAFATESASSAGLIIYNPVVINVVPKAPTDTHAEYDITLARQTAFIDTGYTDASMTQINTFRVILSTNNTGVWLVNAVIDQTGGEGD